MRRYKDALGAFGTKLGARFRKTRGKPPEPGPYVAPERIDLPPLHMPRMTFSQWLTQARVSCKAPTGGVYDGRMWFHADDLGKFDRSGETRAFVILTTRSPEDDFALKGLVREMGCRHATLVEAIAFGDAHPRGVPPGPIVALGSFTHQDLAPDQDLATSLVVPLLVAKKGSIELAAIRPLEIWDSGSRFLLVRP